MNTTATRGEVALTCAACGTTYPLDSLAWRCHCGCVLDLTGFTPTMPDMATIRSRPATLWRYAEALPVTAPYGLSMGEGLTPLITAPQAPGIGLKADHLMPTGSFKDRGAVMLASLAARLGVRRMIADSSGNAGTAIAAYAARAGITCRVYVPAATSSGKIAQLHAYGAEVCQVAGSREDTAEAARQAAGEPGVFYASHVYHPLFLHGTKTYAYELWEQLGGRLPQTLVLPAGNGTLVLGAYLGCTDLLSLRLIDQMPVITAVQSAACAPLAAALADGLAAPAGITARQTIAEGIAIARPARGAQILAAVRDTGGSILTVTDDQVRAGHADLARSGIYVEPTAAACWAAIMSGAIKPLRSAAAHPHAVVPLCGSGLKSKPPGPAPAHYARAMHPYTPSRRAGDLLFVSGQLGRRRR
jgi:threonine synthase